MRTLRPLRGFHSHNLMRVHRPARPRLVTTRLNGYPLVNLAGYRPVEPDSNPAAHGAGFVPRKFISS
jgi:hypothetical protein